MVSLSWHTQPGISVSEGFPCQKTLAGDTESYYAQLGDYDKVAYYQRLLATANGRYDFSQATLNEAVNRSNSVNVQPVTFGAWLTSVWQTF